VPRRLDYTEDAADDLEAIRRWLTQPGTGPAALRRLKAIQASIRELRQHPCLHPVVDQPGVRELPCPHGYRAFYEVHPDTGRNDTAGDVTVLRVFGPGQDRSALDLTRP
jgi:plasmid stabilization system protein ParE